MFQLGYHQEGLTPALMISYVSSPSIAGEKMLFPMQISWPIDALDSRSALCSSLNTSTFSLPLQIVSKFDYDGSAQVSAHMCKEANLSVCNNLSGRLTVPQISFQQLVIYGDQWYCNWVGLFAGSSSARLVEHID